MNLHLDMKNGTCLHANLARDVLVEVKILSV